MENTKQTSKPLHELLTRSLVDIYVGLENTHYILHEKLLCYHSPFFRRVFYNRSNSEHTTKTFGLPDDDDAAFLLFVGWLYSTRLPTPASENDLTHLLDLYLMAERWEIWTLRQHVMSTVREWYHRTDTYPGLRRVQYIYASTEPDAPMRVFMVQAIARMLVLGETIPKHWDKALRKNGQLAVDIIAAVQGWSFNREKVPDPRAEVVEKEKEEAEGAERKGQFRDGESEGVAKADEGMEKVRAGKKPGEGEMVNGLNGLLNGDVD